MHTLFQRGHGPVFHKTDRGFTLIEILLAIGILAILATVAIIAINPARQFAQARNTERWSDVNAIVNAVYQYSVGNKGHLPATIPTQDSLTEICQTNAVGCPGIDLSVLTTNAIYLTAIPVDALCPTGCNEGGSGYTIAITDAGRVHVVASNAELGEVIEIVR